MFAPEELEGLDQTLSGCLDHSRPYDHWIVAVSAGHGVGVADRAGAAEGPAEAGGDVVDEAVVGAAYFAPEPFADRVWNLYFLAVDPDAHRRGVGTVLTHHVVRHLRSAGEDVARVLLVETSSTPAYRQARGFYTARGFEEEARIRDYYGPGDDKVVFWRRLH